MFIINFTFLQKLNKLVNHFLIKIFIYICHTIIGIPILLYENFLLSLIFTMYTTENLIVRYLEKA